MRLPIRILSMILVGAMSLGEIDASVLFTSPIDSVVEQESETEDVLEPVSDELKEPIEEVELSEEDEADNEVSESETAEPDEVVEPVNGEDESRFILDENDPTILTGITAIDADGTDEAIVIPEGIEQIAASALVKRDFASVTFPASLKEIGDYAFYRSNTPRYIFKKTNGLVIGKSAFARNFGITSIEIPEGTDTVGLTAFMGCVSLENVTLPDNVKVGSGAFSRCTKLKNITIPKGFSVNYNYNFMGYNNDNEGGTWQYCGPFGKPASSTATFLPGEDTNLETITFADKELKELPAYLFAGYAFDLPDDIIPDTVEAIGEGAFLHAESLVGIVIPDSVTEIKKSAFEYCKGLLSIVCGPNIDTIRTKAFVDINKDGEFYVEEGSSSLKALLNDADAKPHKINKVFRMSYQLEGGTNNKDNPYILEAGQTSVTLKDPTREGYTFKGWYLNASFLKSAGARDEATGTTIVAVSGNTTVYAKWEKNREKATITYKYVNVPAAIKDQLVNPNPTEYEVGKGLVLQDALVPGLVFMGWYEGDFLNTQRYTIGPNESGPIQLVGYFDTTDHKLIYRDQGDKPFTGYNGQEDYFPYTGYENLPTNLCPSTRPGYTFVGYYLDPDCEGEQITQILPCTIDHDLILYTKWQENTYSVKFDKNNASATGAEMANLSGKYTEKKELTKCTYSVEGKSFIGWSLAANSMDIVYKDAAEVNFSELAKLADESGAVTLYAQYGEPIDKTIDLKKCTVYFGDGENTFNYVAGGVRPTNIVVAGVVATEGGNKTYQNLTEGLDYKLVYPDVVKAGKNTVKVLPVEGNTKVTGSNQISYTVTPIVYDDVLEEETYVSSEKLKAGLEYTGAKLTVDDLKVVVCGTELASTDYTVKYTNNVNVADLKSAKVPTATVTLKGNYKGVINIPFVINPQPISAYTLNLASETLTYSGKELKPKASLTMMVGTKKKTLAASVYTVTYSNNINVGTATVTITGKGNYTGTLTKNFTIENKSLAKAKVVFKYPKYVYDGTASTKQEISVYDGKLLLKKDVDYSVSGLEGSDVGQRKVSITGKGNYKDSLEKTYDVVAVEAKKVVSADCTYFKKGAAAQGPTLVYSISGAQEDFEIKSGSLTAKDVGKYTVVVKPKDGKTNYKGEAKITYEIGTATDITGSAEIILKETSFTYSGAEQKPAISSVKVGTDTLKAADYTVKYVNNKNAGTAQVVVTGKGKYRGSASKNYTIGKASIEEAALTLTGAPVYSGKQQPAKATVKIGKKSLSTKNDYDLIYYDKDMNVIDAPVNAGAYKVRAVAKYEGNYDGSTELKDYTIAKKNISACKINFSSTKIPKNWLGFPKVANVKFGNITLVENTDYQISTFGDGPNRKYRVTVAALPGSENFTGSYLKIFSLPARDYEFAYKNGSKVTFEANTEEDTQIYLSSYYYSISSPRSATIKSLSGNITDKTKIKVQGYNSVEVPKGFIGTITISLDFPKGECNKFSKTLTLEFAPPVYGTLETVNNGGQAIDVKVTKTATSEAAQGYVVKYSTSANMSKAKTVTLSSDGTGKITGLKVGQKYYVALYTTYESEKYKTTRLNSTNCVVVGK